MFNPAGITIQIVKTLYPGLNNSSSHKTSVDELHALVSGQLSRAPYYIRLAMTFLTGLFNMLPLLRWGSTFRSLPAERQRVHAMGWKVSPIKLKRDFINFFESFIILGIYDHPEPVKLTASQRIVAADQQSPPGNGNRS